MCGPFQICTPNRARFFATFKDDFSNFCEIQLLKHKSEVPEAFERFNAKMKTETGQESSELMEEASFAARNLKIGSAKLALLIKSLRPIHLN